MQESSAGRAQEGMNAVDAAFGAIMLQLLGAFIQNNPQAPDKTGQADFAKGAAANPAAPVPPELPAPALLGLQAAEEPSDAGKTAAAFSEAVKAAQGRESGQPETAGKAPAPEHGDEPDADSAAPAIPRDGREDHVGMERMDTLIPGEQVEAGEKADHRETPDPAVMKNDFAGLVQHDQAAARAQDGRAASQQSADAAGRVPVHSSPADAAELIEHAVSIVKDGNRLAVKLEPEGLGTLDINISLEKGLVHTQIQVSDPAVRTLLENNMQQLVQSLLGEGLAVGGFSVAMNGNAPENGTRGDGDTDVKGDAAARQTVETAAASASPGLVSIFV